MKSVDVDWNEFYYTNYLLVSPSNVDQEIGWVKEEFKKINIAYRFLRSSPENDWYPHYVHNLDNLTRYGGCFPAIHVQADICRYVTAGRLMCRAARARVRRATSCSTNARLSTGGTKSPKSQRNGSARATYKVWKLTIRRMRPLLC